MITDSMIVFVIYSVNVGVHRFLEVKEPSPNS
jgi:hypothetical protein